MQVSTSSHAPGRPGESRNDDKDDIFSVKALCGLVGLAGGSGGRVGHGRGWRRNSGLFEFRSIKAIAEKTSRAETFTWLPPRGVAPSTLLADEAIA
jgi:hypothetical protein